MTNTDRLIARVSERLAKDPEIREYSDVTVSIIAERVMRFTLEALADMQREGLGE